MGTQFNITILNRTADLTQKKQFPIKKPFVHLREICFVFFYGGFMMKKIFSRRNVFTVTAAALVLACTSAGFISCQNDTETKYVPITSSSATVQTLATESSLRRCYALDNANSNVIFLMDKALWNVEDGKKVYVHGSFNSWTHRTVKNGVELAGTRSEAFAMTETESFYFLIKPFSDLTALGNSGHPEFKFVIENDLDDGKTEDVYQNNYDKAFIPEPYVFHTSDENLIIIYDNEDKDEIAACSKTASIWKALKDWNLNDPDEVANFANFRKVPGTTNLYRSWHPYKAKTHKSGVFKDATTNPKGYFVRATEPVRHEKVIGLYEANGIQTDICLSENETTNLQTWAVGTDVAKNDNVQDSGTTYTESIPSYYQAILNAGNVLHMTFTNSNNEEEVMQYKYIYQADYNEKYLNDGLQCIIDFLKEGTHPAPYGIHCRLGNDRTGYYCAVISGLCGASWAEIAEDYQKSNYTYLGEYRDQRLLKQVFEKQFNITDITNYTGTQLKSAMYAYYTTNTELQITKADLDALVAKFTANN